MRDVFISHVEEDAGIAEQIAQALEAAGYTTWYYERDSVPGPSYLVQTGRAIEQSEAFALIISPHSLGSHQITKEVVRAHECDKHFVPILSDISHVEFQQRQPEWREAVGAATSISIPPDGVSAILQRMVEGLEALGVGRSGTTEPREEQPTPEEGQAALEVAQSPLLIRTLTGHTDPVTACAISSDGSFIVSASWDGTLKLWDAQTGVERATLGHSDQEGRVKPVVACAISPDGSFIVSASDDHTLKIWDTQTGRERAILEGHTDTVPTCAISPDNSFIVSGSHDCNLKIWGAQRGEERATLAGHTREVRDSAISPDGSYIVSASSDNTLKIWDAQTGEERASLKGHTDYISDFAISPDGSFIISASNDWTLKVWDAQTGEERATLKGHTSDVFVCAISPDGSFMVSGSDDWTLKIWDAQTGEERATLVGHTEGVTSCAISPDGSFIVSTGGGDFLSEECAPKMWNPGTA